MKFRVLNPDDPIVALGGDMKWQVLHVRPRAEKKVADYCGICGIRSYLPLRRETKIYQRRKVIVHKPVFPSYAFAAFGREDRSIVLRSNNVVRLLEPEEELKLVHELEQVRLALNADPTLMSCIALSMGTRVRIKGGAFMGIEGIVARMRNPAKVRLNVEMIGQAVAIEIARELLEPID